MCDAMNDAPLPPAPPSDPGVASGDDKSDKKRKKVRSAWISFVGRIVAQFVGSAATITLGLLLLHKYQPAAKVQASNTSEQTRTVRTDVRAANERSVAVLPLLNLSSNPGQQYVADSMTEILTADLAQIPQLRVLSRTSATNTDTQKRSVPDIAATLGVRYVLEGSVAQADGKVRITAQLIDASRDEHVWARRYDRPARNILDIQDEVAAAIVHDLATAVVNADEAVAVQTSGADRHP
jgi:TolB-like protein